MPADFIWQEQGCFTCCSLKRREETEEVICLISEKGKPRKKSRNSSCHPRFNQANGWTKSSLSFCFVLFFSFQRGNSDVSMHPFFLCPSVALRALILHSLQHLHRQWVFTRNWTQPVQSHSVGHTLVFAKPPSYSKISKYKISPKTLSKYLRNDNNWRSETPRPMWEVSMAGDAGTFEDYLWELLFRKNATPHLISWLLSPLSLFGNCLYFIQGAFWAGSSSLCSSKSGLIFFTSILVFDQAVPVPSQFLPLCVLNMYKCKIYLYFTVSSSICLLHDFIHH